MLQLIQQHLQYVVAGQFQLPTFVATNIQTDSSVWTDASYAKLSFYQKTTEPLFILQLLLEDYWQAHCGCAIYQVVHDDDPQPLRKCIYSFFDGC